MRKKMVFLGLVVFLAINWILVLPVSAKPVELSFSLHLPPVGLLSEQYKKWAKMLEERTDGQVKIKFFWSNSLLSPKEALAGTRSGIADLAIVSGAYQPADLPRLVPWEHAFNASDAWAGMRAANRLVQTSKVLQQEIERNGVKWIAHYTSGTFQFFCKGNWSGVADFKGKVGRTMGGARALWYERLGLKPVFMQVNEIYEGVERGVVWGFENTITLSNILKLYEVIDTVAHINSGMPLSGFCAMNLKKFNALPKNIQQIIVDTGIEWGENSLARSIIEAEQGIVKQWEKKGKKFVKPTPKDLATMKEFGRKVAMESAEKQDKKLKTPGETVGILQTLWGEVDKAQDELAAKGYPWGR